MVPVQVAPEAAGLGHPVPGLGLAGVSGLMTVIWVPARVIWVGPWYRHPPTAAIVCSSLSSTGDCSMGLLSVLLLLDTPTALLQANVPASVYRHEGSAVVTIAGEPVTPKFGSLLTLIESLEYSGPLMVSPDVNGGVSSPHGPTSFFAPVVALLVSV